MTHFTTTLSSINFSLSAYTTFLNLENINNVTLGDFNVSSTTLEPVHHGPPSSPYNLTQMIIIAIVFTILALLTVIGNFMVSLKISQLIRGEGCTSFHAIGDDRRRGKFLLDALFAIKTHFLREIQCCAGDEA